MYMCGKEGGVGPGRECWQPPPCEQWWYEKRRAAARRLAGADAEERRHGRGTVRRLRGTGAVRGWRFWGVRSLAKAVAPTEGRGGGRHSWHLKRSSPHTDS